MEFRIHNGILHSFYHVYRQNVSDDYSEWVKKQRAQGSYDDRLPKGLMTHIQNPAYVELVRIALCYYIAKLDGVSDDEQEILDGMIEGLLDDPRGGSEFRAELRMILADKGTKFENVKRYLNRIDTTTLEEFKNDAIQIAETTGGITENEQQAIDLYQKFIEERKKLEEESAK